MKFNLLKTSKKRIIKIKNQNNISPNIVKIILHFMIQQTQSLFELFIRFLSNLFFITFYLFFVQLKFKREFLVKIVQPKYQFMNQI